MSLNSREFVEKGFSNANAEGFSVVVLCFDISRRFLFINNESAREASDSDSLAIKEVCGRDSGIKKVICISPCLDEGVLISKLDVSFISFCIISPCLEVGVLKFSDSIFSIWI
jgi:hypothetical protein